MSWLYNWLHEVCQCEIKYLKLEATLVATSMVRERQQFEERLKEKDQLLAKANQKIALLEAENEQMRMVMMPHSSSIGAAYARSKAAINQNIHPKIEAVSNPVVVKDWVTYLNDHMRSAEQDEKAQEKKSNGV